MKSLYESLLNAKYTNQVLEEYSILEGEEILQINESFQSSILIALAKAIQHAEKDNAENDKKEAQRYKEQGYYGTPSKSAKSFASIFGPITLHQRWGKTKTGIQGLKWSEIKDDDFELYKSVSADDKTFAKILKNCYLKKLQANFVCCEPGTKNVVIFIKGYSNTPGDVRVFGLKSKWGNRDAVTEKTATKYKYGERPLKFDEAMAVISGLDVYVLKITDDMKTEYTKLHDTRIASQEGVINYDERSLKDMLREQKARYQAMVKEIKAKKLEGDPKQLIEKINKVHAEAIATMEKILSNPENMDEYFNVSRLLSYCSRAYESFYDAFNYKALGDKKTERARQRAKDKGEDFDEQEFDRLNFDKSSAKEKFNDVDAYCKEVEKMIEDMKKRMK